MRTPVGGSMSWAILPGRPSADKRGGVSADLNSARLTAVAADTVDL